MTMGFKTNLKMEHIPRTERYFLLKELIYLNRKGEKRTVPLGFDSDGHSIPKLLRSIAGSPFATKYPKSAWLHDYLCKMLVHTGLMPRKEADKEYSEAMRDEGASKFQCGRNYTGVRIGAGFQWITKLFKRKKVTNGEDTD